MNYKPDTIFKADILIVDDTPDNLRFLSSLLLDEGYNVRKSTNGQMALTAVKTVPPDLILLDVNMPNMSGYEVCELLKKDSQTSSVPVIFLSALDDVMDKVKAFKVGGVDYITKPFKIEEVLARIQNQLTIRNLQNELQAQNTQLQQALNELKKTQAQLVQKEKMLGLGQLAAGMAHEINNSIGFVSSNLEPASEYIQDLLKLINLYQQEYPNPSIPIQEAIQEIDLDFLSLDIKKIMGSMQTGAERISTMILALRIFSRLNESDIKAVDIHEGLDSTLLLLQHRLRKERKCPEIKVIKQYGNLPLVTCYASQLNQVFFNLLNNAIDAIDSGLEKGITELSSPTIWINTELTAYKTVKIQIKDNGIGIDEKVRSRLFNPFFTTKPVGQGSGLGLVTSYEIVVEKHKGELRCNSLPGQGAEFTIEIPVQLIKNIGC
ncbi:hybrid sensor histidine kinase/response regulator [Funiculus sociatus GB2-A5]|uniref:histidine kinase n=1 Tax=Funiculus sociatus GB2-A5 TaxID=2933946 RepID=A0ABV0JUR4_9CYAN|nr:MULTISPECIES: hybrid sensor histidine kinase/response regulator [unclassified Trichocoleus]MBD1907985.1 hybrid sensor histidine kinase/response regulator [Trichocoleus sp. FACHB-832]MBD2065126.1 hybrid sensor histidine kinase/response regulator [Trichocoleus sp. FACHB-6]